MLTNQGFFKNSHKYNEIQTNHPESFIFPHHQIWKPINVKYLCMCLSFSAQPSCAYICFLSDGWRVIAPLVLSAGGNGFDWPNRHNSGSVALSVCISSRKLSCWKRLITGLKSGVMIVYWTHFPPGFLSLLLSVSLFHFVPIFFLYLLPFLCCFAGEWPSFN